MGERKLAAGLIEPANRLTLEEWSEEIACGWST